MLGLRGSSISQPPPQPQNTAAMTVPTTNGHVNGYQNGHTTKSTTNGSTSQSHVSKTETHSESATTRTESRTLVASSHAHTHTFTSDQQVTIVRQTVITTRTRLLVELRLSHVNESYIDLMNLDSFVEYIAHERLTSMPARGSRWDKVLKWAEFFAAEIGQYEEAISPFVRGSKSASRLIWAACRVLIEMGDGNAQALETAFEVFHKVALSLRFFNLHNKLLSRTSRIRAEVGQAFNDLLILVSEVAIFYHHTASHATVSLDFTSRFGNILNDFYSRKDRIIDAMWACTLEDDSSDIHVVRTWLSIHDTIVKILLRDRATARSRRDEFTCDWFETPLLDFSRGKGYSKDVLAITGPSGCGKTILSGWIVERLQRQLGKKFHETLTVFINHDLPKECTELAIAKNIALQLLQTNIGDTKFLNALSKVHQASLGATNSATLEKGLWDAIHIGLTFESSNLMIIIDGLDNRCGDQVVIDVGKKIVELAAQHAHLKAIILSRDAKELPKDFPKDKLHIFSITADHTHNDVEHIAKHQLKGCQHYLNKNQQDQEKIVKRITKMAKGNFLWVKLTAENLRLESSSDNFNKAIDHAEKSPKSLKDLVRDSITRQTENLANVEAKNILSWLLVSRRPLTVVEIKSLLRVDLQKRCLVNRNTDVSEDIVRACGYLVNIQNGIVRFAHSAVRDELLNIAAENKLLHHRHDLQTELVIRLLAYCKFRLTHPFHCTFDCPDNVDVGTLFMQDALLEYATRNWISHFKRSSLRKEKSLHLTGDFKGFFPSSAALVMMEWSCWRLDRTILEALDFHDLALEIRKEVFSEKHESVFQNLIICGHLHRRSSKASDAETFFYRASHVGQSLFKGYHAATMSCTTAFLEITEKTVFTTRTELVTRREELLQYAISSYKQHISQTSEVVIKYSKVLAELYVSIKEETKAKTIWKELQEIMISKYGKGSAEELSISGHLNIVLKKTEKREEITEYEKEIFEEVAEYEIWNVQRIKVTIEMAIECEARGELLRAEELYITLWRGLIIYCQSEQSHYVDIDIRISMIKVSLEYVRFLRRHHRHEEASSVLICVWAEYEEYDFESEEIFIQLKIVGELMRSISLLSIAVSVFKKCWSWFKLHGKEEHSSSCQILISETVQEIVTKSTTTTVTTKKSTTTTTSTSTETVVKEIYESTMSKSVVTIESISICRSLVSLYIKNEQWSEAITVLKRSLELAWKVVISGGGTIALPREFGSESIELAIQLAICHLRSHHFHEAESIYLRIYRACFHSCQVHDKRFTRAYETLIKFYTEHGHWHRVVSIHQEVLVASRKQLGAKHEMTIKILYKLGSICHEHGHGHAHEYYEEIITVLNGSTSVCHHDAFHAMKWVCRSYYEQGMWAKLKLTCEILWETWINHHHGVTFDVEFVELLYTRYIYVLQYHIHVSYEVLRTITIQYRETCVKIFGAFAAITIRAIIELAEISMRSEKHVHEAISYYEEVIKTTKTTTTTTTTTTETKSVVSTSILSTIREKLTKAYIHVCSHGSVSTTIIERAIAVLVERYESLIITYGYAHTETLTVLRELIIMYWKVKTKESRTIIVRMLQESIICILTKEKHSRTLYDAAKIVAGLYLRCELHSEGRILLREIHRQIISKNYSSSDKCGFKLDHSISKACYVFLVTFEEIIQGSASISYSRIMADLLTQSILFESYTSCLKIEKNVEKILTAGARYYCFLETSQWTEQLTIIQSEMYTLFTKHYVSIKMSKEITTLFIVSLLKVLGSENSTVYIGKAACRAANIKIRELLLEGDYQCAYELGLCAFSFIQHQRAYHELKNVPYGFKLSGLMALRGVTLTKAVEPELHTKMLDLSRKIIGEVLKACKDSKINFIRLKPSDLNDLVGLLGEQQNYAELETLLKALWASREIQKAWSPTTITDLGARYVCALFLSPTSAHNSTQAISLCKAITYNVRRVYGALDSKALQMSELLSQIYTKAGMHKDAMRVHEDILRLVVEGDDDNDDTIDELSPRDASRHLSMLKQAWIRNQGWDKAPAVYKDLIDSLLAMPEYKGTPEFASFKKFDDWKLNDKLEKSGEFTRPVDWEFVDPADLDAELVGSVSGSATPSVTGAVCGYGRVGRKSMGLRRITSNWGMNLHMLGPRDDKSEPAILVPSAKGLPLGAIE